MDADAINGHHDMIGAGSFADQPRRPATPNAVAAGLAVAVLVVLAFLLMPITVIESMATDSGVAGWSAEFAPPFGPMTRWTIAVVAALVSGGLIWLGLSLIAGARSPAIDDDVDESGIPMLRRADAHPDAPARRPVLASSDLGTPFLDIRADLFGNPTVDAPKEPIFVSAARGVPPDLDTPIADYWTPDNVPLPDPDPVLDLEPVAVLRTLPRSRFPRAPAYTSPAAARFVAVERSDPFGVNQSRHDETSAPLPAATIHDLLERLDRSASRSRSQPEPREQTLEETLDALRALARRVG